MQHLLDFFKTENVGDTLGRNKRNKIVLGQEYETKWLSKIENSYKI